MTKLKHCMVTNNLARYNDYKINKTPNIFDLIKILDGEIHHSRYLMPVLKSKNFDIIHINFSKEDCDLINSIWEIISRDYHYDTKIIVFFDVPFEKINLDITDRILLGADLLLTLYESDVKLISNCAQYKTVKYFNFLKNSDNETIRKRFFDLLYDCFWEPDLKYNSIWLKYDLCKNEIPEPEKNTVLFENNIILGCNTNHDGCVSLLQNNELVYSIESEKDSNPRYSSHFNELEAHLKKMYEDQAFPEVISIIGDYKYNKYSGINDSYVKFLKRKILERTCNIHITTHERAHLFCSYGMSPFPQKTPCYMLDWEGIIGRFYRINEKMEINMFDTVMEYPGNKYILPYSFANFTNYHFLDLSSAGKIMALAGFADKNDTNEYEEINYIMNSDDIFNRKKDYNEIYLKLKKSDIFKAGIDSQIFKNFAYKIQDKIFNKFYDFAKKNLNEHLPLLIGGGCGLNCNWNTRWKNSGLFEDVFVPPIANDSGIAIGAAIDAQYHFTGNAKIKWNVFSGEEFIMDKTDIRGFDVFNLENAQIADFLLKDDNVIAWVQDKYEIGPRALCHRSLLASPFKKEMHVKLNKIKNREQFRPIAPVCIEEDVSFYFDWNGRSPFMLYFQQIKDSKLKAVTHADGTARIQTVCEKDNKKIYDLLKEFKKQSGYSVLCNTSLNFKGKGFINRMSDLIKYVMYNDVNGMVVNDKFYIKKKYNKDVNGYVQKI